MSQKSRFKMQTQGNYKYRWTFPQLPWGTINNPTYIQTAHGYYLSNLFLTSALTLVLSHTQQPPPDEWLVEVLP